MKYLLLFSWIFLITIKEGVTRSDEPFPTDAISTTTQEKNATDRNDETTTQEQETTEATTLRTNKPSDSFKKVCDYTKYETAALLMLVGTDQIVVTHEISLPFFNALSDEFISWQCGSDPNAIFEKRKSLLKYFIQYGQFMENETRSNLNFENYKNLSFYQALVSNLQSLQKNLYPEFKIKNYKSSKSLSKIFKNIQESVTAKNDQLFEKLNDNLKNSNFEIEKVTKIFIEFAQQKLKARVNHCKKIIDDNINYGRNIKSILGEYYSDYYSSESSRVESFDLMRKGIFSLHQDYYTEVTQQQQTRLNFRNDMINECKNPIQKPDNFLESISTKIYKETFVPTSKIYSVLSNERVFNAWKQTILNYMTITAELYYACETLRYFRKPNDDRSSDYENMFSKTLTKINDHFPEKIFGLSKNIDQLYHGQLWINSIGKVLQSLMESTSLKNLQYELNNLKVSSELKKLIISNKSNGIIRFYSDKQLPNSTQVTRLLSISSSNSEKLTKEIAYLCCLNENDCYTEGNFELAKKIAFCPGITLIFFQKYKALLKLSSPLQAGTEPFKHFEQCNDFVIQESDWALPKYGFCFEGINTYTNKFGKVQNELSSKMNILKGSADTYQWAFILTQGYNCWWNEGLNKDCITYEKKVKNSFIIGEQLHLAGTVENIDCDCYNLCAHSIDCAAAAYEDKTRYCTLFKKPIQLEGWTEVDRDGTHLAVMNWENRIEKPVADFCPQK